MQGGRWRTEKVTTMDHCLGPPLTHTLLVGVGSPRMYLRFQILKVLVNRSPVQKTLGLLNHHSAPSGFGTGRRRGATMMVMVILFRGVRVVSTLWRTQWMEWVSSLEAAHFIKFQFRSQSDSLTVHKFIPRVQLTRQCVVCAV